MKKLLLIGFILLGNAASAQYLQLLDASQNWILKTSDIKDNSLVFVNYEKKKVDLNTMIWKFLPNGRLEYDYQSSETIYACAGVNFLDMDVDECLWTYNPSTLILTLQIKGGYASLDDFVFKRDYKVGMLDEDDGYGYTLTLDKEQYFNDLTN
ncbi:hypothetical protein [Arcticibacterium luteifluviistationis]|uniref:Lipocalin-like domain-containing protein n=1 Tax=Arcticibacterium luteifluviistationis TaxID=1784714 RepID=A0A2Z4GCU6_9BACT|nr:hypothetical protein [Arcticibacterium luteifluviistationis]AWV99132.1 hypothetical protein DJ013_13530 [Arcticibacterium luteifluviistationis]